MIFDAGKTVKDLVNGRSIEQLKEDSDESRQNVTENSNPYRDKGYISSAKELMFYVDVLNAGLEDQTVMVNSGRWKVLGKYWFFSQSGKWSVVGTSKIYKSKGFTDFVERFLSSSTEYKTLKGLHSNYVFQIVDGVHVAFVGKHKGKTLREVKLEDEAYWNWAVTGARVQGIEEMTYAEVCNL